ncbi:serine/threonine-protein kinase Nek2-like [Hippocampus zosterae]|uniref:serine/threonine-protein kinase Nek2-like n=1 Tax=Hippocampus zosterae TaxID=109293 RepID=UPI00223E208D|nr:serine/threonine-protein kinase Nek2-like [Hippocampus zosterae]
MQIARVKVHGSRVFAVQRGADELGTVVMLRRGLWMKIGKGSSEVWKAAGQLLEGLHELHQNKIIHRDLKSANIFISKSSYKIGDFNVSKVLKEGMAITQTGTPYYASPEIWREMPYNEKSDIWSLGCILYEMCALRPPFVATTMADLASKVTRGRFEHISKKYSKELNAFIASMLRVNPHHRPTIAEMLQNENIPASSAMRGRRACCCGLSRCLKIYGN